MLRSLMATECSFAGWSPSWISGYRQSPLTWKDSPGKHQDRRDVFLILFTESLDVRFAVGIEEFLAALMPRRFEFRRCDVPVRPAFLANGA